MNKKYIYSIVKETSYALLFPVFLTRYQHKTLTLKLSLFCPTNFFSLPYLAVHQTRKEEEKKFWHVAQEASHILQAAPAARHASLFPLSANPEPSRRQPSCDKLPIVVPQPAAPPPSRAFRVACVTRVLPPPLIS